MRIYKDFLQHSVKRTFRSLRGDLNLILRFVVLLSIGYLVFFLFYISLNFEQILHTTRPDLDAIGAFNSILIYPLLILSLILWFFKIKFSDELIPYLHLPINRKKVISYLIIKKVLNSANLCFLILVIPFSLKNIPPAYGQQGLFFYLTGILLILLLMNFLLMFLKAITLIRSSLILIYPVLFFPLILASLLFHKSIMGLSGKVLLEMMNGNIIIMAPIVLIVVLLSISVFVLFKRVVYLLDTERAGLTQTRSAGRIKLTGRLPGYAALEIRLITRNRSLRSTFFMSLGMFLLFTYIVVKGSTSVYVYFFSYLLTSGMFGYFFAQLLFGWESSFFDFLSTSRFDMVKYLKSKYIIYSLSGLVVFVILLPLAAKDLTKLHLLITSMIYNISAGYFVIFFFATFNNYRIDLNKTIFFKFEANNLILGLVFYFVFGLPALLLALFLTFTSMTISLLMINILCLISLAFHNKWFRLINKQLMRRKYKNLEGYRK